MKINESDGLWVNTASNYQAGWQVVNEVIVNCLDGL